MDIDPTHTCFDDVVEYFMPLIAHGATSKDLEQYHIVHAACEWPEGGLYAHAWLERGDEAIGSGVWRGMRVYFTAARRDFYRHFRPVEMNRYTFEEVMNKTTGGPWEERYRQLCNDDKTTMRGKHNGTTNRR